MPGDIIPESRATSVGIRKRVAEVDDRLQALAKQISLAG